MISAESEPPVREVKSGLDPLERERIERRFIWIASLIVILLAAIPALYALLSTPAGSKYLGFQYNTDDHMVYAAWMRQAMDGHFFFDNRFTTDVQPGLTVHLYFWMLGLFAKVLGIPLAANLARLFFSGLFVHLLYRLIRRVSDSVYTTRLAVALVVFGGGLGFLVWHNFGQALVKPETRALGILTFGTLPTDVWQPEGFVFPSMLTNGLFMVSLSLILYCFDCYLRARESWKPVLGGAIAIGLLMNIHSYDVLIVGFALVGLAAMELAQRRLTKSWLLRSVFITTGVVPAALWFAHVLQSDQVFQMRAATPTYSANFRQVFSGYALMVIIGLAGLGLNAKTAKQRGGLGLIIALLAGLLVAAGSAGDSYFLVAPMWAGVLIIALAALYLLSSEEPAFNLVLAWAVLGIVALYFPALFQRKLAEGLSIPWAILSALSISRFLLGRERNARNLATVMVILLCGATSVRWLFREKEFIQNNVANTTMHTPFLSRDMLAILAILNEDREKKVVLAMPGIWSPAKDSNDQPIPDQFLSPVIPDLNSVISGLTGAYTVAGHWSETPNYIERRSVASRFFLSKTADGARKEMIAANKVTYVVAPSRETYGNAFADISTLGESVYTGTQFNLIKIRP